MLHCGTQFGVLPSKVMNTTSDLSYIHRWHLPVFYCQTDVPLSWHVDSVVPLSWCVDSVVPLSWCVNIVVPLSWCVDFVVSCHDVFTLLCPCHDVFALLYPCHDVFALLCPCLGVLTSLCPLSLCVCYVVTCRYVFAMLCPCRYVFAMLCPCYDKLILLFPRHDVLTLLCSCHYVLSSFCGANVAPVCWAPVPCWAECYPRCRRQSGGEQFSRQDDFFWKGDKKLRFRFTEQIWWVWLLVNFLCDGQLFFNVTDHYDCLSLVCVTIDDLSVWLCVTVQYDYDQLVSVWSVWPSVTTSVWTVTISG